ncbi:hypothetical protein COOONC_13852, partial [Cooperia oncophora]
MTRTDSFRHWQSPTARLMVCWRRWGQTTVRKENCHPAEPSRQSQVISQSLAVPKGTNVQVLFIMEKADGGVNAVVMIDRILMNVKKCMPNEEKNEASTRPPSISIPPQPQSREKNMHLAASSTGKSAQPAPPPPKKDPSQLTLIDDSAQAKALQREDARKLIRHLIQEANISKMKDRKSGEVRAKEFERAGRSTERVVSTGEISSPATLLSPSTTRRLPSRLPHRYIPDMDHSKELVGGSAPPMPPPSPLSKPEEFDPLTDLLGKELVDFLDPNYVTKDDEEEVDYSDG